MTTEGLRALRGRPVLDLSTATTVGVVGSAVLDPGSGGVALLVLDKVSGPANLLPWQAIASVGPDAVTIASAAELVAPQGPAEERAGSGDLDPLRKPVLSDQGRSLGTITDVVVDTTDGAIEGLDLGATPDVRLEVVGAGSYAVVVRVQ